MDPIVVVATAGIGLHLLGIVIDHVVEKNERLLSSYTKLQDDPSKIIQEIGALPEIKPGIDAYWNFQKYILRIVANGFYAFFVLVISSLHCKSEGGVNIWFFYLMISFISIIPSAAVVWSVTKRKLRPANVKSIRVLYITSWISLGILVLSLFGHWSTFMACHS